MFGFDLSLFRFQTTNTNFCRDQPTVEGTEKVQILGFSAVTDCVTVWVGLSFC